MNESFSFTSTINHESSLILLCLDYLKQLRRTHHHNQQPKEQNEEQDECDTHKNHNHINYDYITLAIWALTRCFKEPKDLQWNMDHHYHTTTTNNYKDDTLMSSSSSIFQDRSYKMGNDPYYSFAQVQSRLKLLHTQRPQTIGKLTSQIVIPTLDMMEAEMLHMTNHPTMMTQSQKNHSNYSSLATYKYDDYHYSNSHRYYKNNGLDSIPLTLPTIVQEGLVSLQAKTRMEAEMDLQKDPMYIDFYQAVKNKGYFQVLTTDIMIRKRNVACKHFTLDQVKQDILRDRHKKVMTKFRLKVAAGVGVGVVSDGVGVGVVGGSNTGTVHTDDVTTTASSTTASTTTTTLSKNNNHKSKHWSKDTMSLPSVPTASTDCEEDDDEDKENHVHENVDKGEQTSHGTALMSLSSSSSSNRLNSMNAQDCPTPAVTRESRKIVPLKKAIVSSVPLTRSSSHKSSLNGDHDSVNNIHFNEDDLCSKVSQKSGRSRVSSICSSVMDDPEKIQEAETYKAQGNECMKQKKYEKAKHFYTLAIELLPFGKTSHVYYCNRAAALLSMRYFSEAAFDAEQSIELKPRYSKAYCRLGLANFFLGNYQKAIDSYTIALKYDPENETSKMYLERSEKKLQVKSEEFPTFKKEEETRSTYAFQDQECTSNQEQPTLQEERLDWMQKKAQLVKVRRLQKEESRLAQKKNDTKERENDEEVEAAANQLKSEGNKAMARKQYDEAINFYSQALRLSPAGPSSHIYYTNRSAAFCHLGRYEDSESDAERALSLEPESSKAHSRLGLSRYFLRDYEGAVEAYESAVHYDPTNSVNLAYLEKAKRKLAAIQK